MADSLNDVIGKLRADAERDAFNNQLGDALEAADTETAAHGIVARAIHTIAPNLPAELLVSDSSRSHLERAAFHLGVDPPGCNVESPLECLAVRRGTTQIFEDSNLLNACTHLQDAAAVAYPRSACRSASWAVNRRTACGSAVRSGADSASGRASRSARRAGGCAARHGACIRTHADAGLDRCAHGAS